jgi:preprotein translocase SecE subunit
VPAREDRAKRRRERREETGSDARPHERPRAADGRASEPARSAIVAPHRTGAVGFVREAVGELKKVDWPGQSQVIQATTVVIIACIIVGTWLYANDLVWQKVVKNFLLK